MTYEEVQTLLQMINVDLDEQYALRLFKVTSISYFCCLDFCNVVTIIGCIFLVHLFSFATILAYQYYCNIVILILNLFCNFQLYDWIYECAHWKYHHVLLLCQVDSSLVNLRIDFNRH